MAETEAEVIAKFEKNATEEVRVSLTEYKGHRLIDLRVYYAPPGREAIPTKKGLTMSIDLFSELEAAIVKLGEVLKNMGQKEGQKETDEE